mmetsp:Transcript_61602/g.137258  ORF Transcript_61602/g.137258 Transcript_61602/m.137258 type:complete len:219 (-) Transcript_61602:907-1563(-)
MSPKAKALCQSRTRHSQAVRPHAVFVCGIRLPLFTAASSTHQLATERRSELIDIVEGVVAEADLILVVASVLRESPLGPQIGERRRHRCVLILDGELTLIRVSSHDRLCHFTAPGRRGRSSTLDDLGPHRRRDMLGPLVDVHLGGRLVVLGIGNVADDGELLGACGEDHLTHVARTALAVLTLGIRVCVHAGHGELQHLDVSLGALDGRAEKVETTHV